MTIDDQIRANNAHWLLLGGKIEEALATLTRSDGTKITPEELESRYWFWTADKLREVMK